METNSPLETSLLPQYRESAAFMERFLVAAHIEGGTIQRSQNNQRIKQVDEEEIFDDRLGFFSDNLEEMRDEFTTELRDRIGANTFDTFCDVIANEWFDGKRLRVRGRPHQLKRSIHDYLNSFLPDSAMVGGLIQVDELPTEVEPLISIEAVESILEVNHQMLYRHIEAWKEIHPNRDIISSNDIYLRRGLALLQELETAEGYREWDFINSYSLSFSSPEQFAQMREGHLPAIVNGELALFENRVLFFSPFIPGMEVGQLELGVIPSLLPLPIHYQGLHAGVLEYIIDPRPFQR